MVASVFINFCKFILKSLLASAIAFIVSLSVMTKKFPPDFSQVKSSYDIIRNLQDLSQKKLSEPIAAPENNFIKTTTEDEDIQELIQQHQKVLMPFRNYSESGTEVKPEQVKIVFCQNQDELVQNLKSKIEELDNQNLSLNTQLLKLKYKKQ